MTLIPHIITCMKLESHVQNLSLGAVSFSPLLEATQCRSNQNTLRCFSPKYSCLLVSLQNHGSPCSSQSTMAGNDGVPSHDKIEISVKGQDGRIVYFKVKSVSRLNGLFITYCQRMQLEYGTVNFYYDGHRVNGRQTPRQLKMENGDEIVALRPVDGGGSWMLRT